MKELVKQLKWQFTLLNKNKIIAISIAVTVVYALIFFIIKDIGNADKILTLLILNDPAIIGLFFIGLSIMIERDQQVLPALFVTPLSHHIYLIVRIIALSSIGWICALAMGFAALGTSFQFIHFSAGVLGICILSCLAGIYLVSTTKAFLNFMLKSIPILMIFINLPLLNYFGITNISAFKLMPAQGSLDLIANSYSASPDISAIIYGYITTALWIAALYWFIYKRFMTKVVNI